jgi:NMD protein affecting ribosome stability and mRNA decay
MSRPRCPSCGKSVKNTAPPRDNRLCDKCLRERRQIVLDILAGLNNPKSLSP